MKMDHNQINQTFKTMPAFDKHYTYKMCDPEELDAKCEGCEHIVIRKFKFKSCKFLVSPTRNKFPCKFRKNNELEVSNESN
jgi:hypothetical protein